MTLRSAIRKTLEFTGKKILSSSSEFPENLPLTLLEYRPEKRVEANNWITKALELGEPFLVSRFGNDELAALLHVRHLKQKLSTNRLIESLAIGDPFFSFVRYRARLQKKGIKPLSKPYLFRFADLYFSAIEEVDLLGSWIRGENFFQESLESSVFCRLEELEPYRSESGWTPGLEGKKVLVVHPFLATILHQYRRNREFIFSGANSLPNFELILYSPPRAHFGEIINAEHWFCELSRMRNEIVNLDFDIAIIGAGPFGMPLAASIKRSGRSAIHLGGATQLLFGIKGSRWLSDPQIQTLVNEHWTAPLSADTPSMKKRRISGNSYW